MERIPMNTRGLVAMIRNAHMLIAAAKDREEAFEKFGVPHMPREADRTKEAVAHLQAMIEEANGAPRQNLGVNRHVAMMPFWAGMFQSQLVTPTKPTRTRFFLPGSPMEKKRKRPIREPGSVAQVVAIYSWGIRLLWHEEGDFLELPWSMVRRGAIEPLTWRDYTEMTAWTEDPDPDDYPL